MAKKIASMWFLYYTTESYDILYYFGGKRYASVCIPY